jgi:predicted DNA-binding protein with PD1-like motif
MRYSEAKQGRVFIIRLEDGEIIQDSIESFAIDKNITHAKIQIIGGADKGSRIIVGPKHGRDPHIKPMSVLLDEMHEVVGNGTIIPDEFGNPKLHCHIACGRGSKTICGEIRSGVIVWHVIEVVITELLNCKSVRKEDPHTGFSLLWPEKEF